MIRRKFAFWAILIVLCSPKVEAMCALALADAQIIFQTDPRVDHVWRSSLQFHGRFLYDEDTSDMAYEAFVERLVKRVDSAVGDSPHRDKILIQAMDEARPILISFLKKNKKALQGLETKYHRDTERNRDRKKITIQIANRVLDEISLDRIVWRNTAPFLMEFHSGLGLEKARLFDRYILMVANIIDTELESTELHDHRKSQLRQKYLKRAALAISNRLEEARADQGRYYLPGGETPKLTKGYRAQSDYVIRKVKKDIQLHEISWMRMAPQTASLSSDLSIEVGTIFDRVVPDFVRRTSVYAARMTGTETLMEGMAILDPHIAESLPLIIQADLEIYGPMNTQESMDERDERIIQIAIASHKMFLAPQAPTSAQVLNELGPERFLIFVRYFPYYLTTLRERRKAKLGSEDGWEEDIEATMALFTERVMLLHAQRNFRDIPLRSPNGKMEGLEYRFFTEGVYNYSPSDELDGAWLEFYNSLQDGKEKELFMQYRHQFQEWVDSRIFLFADRWPKTVALRRDLEPITFEAIREAIRYEVENHELERYDLADRDRQLELQAMRLRESVRSRMPLTSSETIELPDNFRNYRNSIEDPKTLQTFDLSLALFAMQIITKFRLKTQNADKWPEVKARLFERSFEIFIESFEDTTGRADLASGRSQSGREWAIATAAQASERVKLEDLFADLSEVDPSVVETVEETRLWLTQGVAPNPFRQTKSRDVLDKEQENAVRRRRLESAMAAYVGDITSLPVHTPEEQAFDSQSMIDVERMILKQIMVSAPAQLALTEALSQIEEKPSTFRIWMRDLNGNNFNPLDQSEQALATEVVSLLQRLQDHPDEDTVSEALVELQNLGVARKFWQSYFLEDLRTQMRADPELAELNYGINRKIVSILVAMHRSYFEKNLRLVFAALKETKTGIIDPIEFISVGNEQMMADIWIYDPATGFNFSTYTMNNMIQKMHRYSAAESSAIRGTTRTARAQYNLLERAAETFRQENQGREPTEEELSEITGIKLSRIAEVRARSNSFSLDQGISGSQENRPTGRLISSDADTRIPPEVTSLFAGEDGEMWRSYIDQLDPTDQTIVKARFGFGDYSESHTLEETGKIIGLTKERVRQRQKDAFEALMILHYDTTIGFEDPSTMDLLSMTYKIGGLGSGELAEWRETHRYSQGEVEVIVERGLRLAREEFQDYMSSMLRNER